MDTNIGQLRATRLSDSATEEAVVEEDEQLVKKEEKEYSEKPPKRSKEKDEYIHQFGSENKEKKAKVAEAINVEAMKAQFEADVKAVRDEAEKTAILERANAIALRDEAVEKAIMLERAKSKALLDKAVKEAIMLERAEADKKAKLASAEADKKAKLASAEADKKAKLASAEADKKAKLASAEADKKAKLASANENLQLLANKNYKSVLGRIDIESALLTNLQKVEIEKEFIDEFAGIVKSFNSSYSPGESTEKSGSIGAEHSVHNLWRNLFRCIQKFCGGLLKRRILYEWRIYNPTTYNLCNTNSIDYTFIRITDAHFSWGNYSGGLELKNTSKTPISSLSSSSKASCGAFPLGSMASDGMRQALSRAAMCVLDRRRSASHEGSFRAYCCYADSRRLGLARVTLDDKSLVVTAEIMPLIDLPGFSESNIDTALRLLVFLLTSEPEEISFLSTPPSSSPTEISCPDSSVDPWHLGAYLGSGSFAAVYADKENDAYVVKVPHEEESNLKIVSEMSTLRLLRDGNVESIPTVVGELLNNCLKLSPLGIPIYTFVSHCPSPKLLCELISRMGPVLVDILQSAHGLGVAHRDIRRSNILILPSKEEILDYIVCMVDESGLDALMSRLRINECSFILNDWSEAKCEVVDQKVFIKDLRLLVQAMIQIDYVTDSSPYRRGKLAKLKKDRTAETAGLIKDESRDSSYRLEVGARLEEGFAMADSRDYDGLRSLLSGLNSV